MYGIFSDKRIGLRQVRYPPIVVVADYLERKRGTRPFPARADVLPEELRCALGKIILLDVRYDPFDFVFRLYGSKIAAMERDEMTGKSVRDVEPAPYREILTRHYAEAVTERSPGFYEIVVTVDHTSAGSQRAVIPLSNDGAAVNMLLTVSDWNDDFDFIWPRVQDLD